MECETSASLGNQRRSSYKMPIPLSSKEVVAIMKYFMEGMPKSAGIHEIELWESQPLLMPASNSDKSLLQVAIPDASTEDLRHTKGNLAEDIPLPVSSDLHIEDSDPLSGALDLQDHSLPFLRRTAYADGHYRTLLSSGPCPRVRKNVLQLQPLVPQC